MSKKRIATLVAVLLLAGAGLYVAYRRSWHRGAPTTSTYPAGAGSSTPSPALREPGAHGKPGAAATEGGKARVSTAETGLILRPGESLEFAANVTKLDSTVANLKIL